MLAAALDAADPTSTAVLTVDLGALRANYRTLHGRAAPAECTAVIKANAYGTGAEEVARALADEGCQTYFVATFGEAARVRKAVADATVYVLDGFFSESGEAFAAARIRPVLSSPDELRDWLAFCEKTQVTLPAALHVDTGMNRLGMTRAEAEKLVTAGGLLARFRPALLISHLACADEPGHPMNEAQLKAFEEVRALFPPCPASLANSAGIFLGERYHFDLVRAGFALYGGRAMSGRPALAPVVQLHARIAQIHDAEAGETVGYGAAQRLRRRTRIATLSLGYADGILRRLGARDGRAGLTGYIGDRPAPVIGRISMDLITLDVTGVPEDVARRGAWVEILGSHVSVDDLAEQAGTIGYEVLTSLGRRAQRIYVDSGPERA
jgi:alanine racemase